MKFQKISKFPHRGDWNFWGDEGSGSVRPKKVKKFMKLNWNFQRGGRGWGWVLEKVPFVGEVWIFSGIAIRKEYAISIVKLQWNLRNRKHVQCIVFLSSYKHEWKFGRTRNAVGTRAAGKCFHSFFEFSQTFTSVCITRYKH